MTKTRIQSDIVQAMKQRDATRVKVLRMAMAAIKQYEIDNRTDITDAIVSTVLQRMIKQRNDAKCHYHDANRQDLHDQEVYEIEVLQAYLPQPLSQTALTKLISTAIKQTQATEMKDMSRVIAYLRPNIQGTADMKQVSQLVMLQLKKE